MKNWIYILFGAVATLAACEVIPENERLVDVEVVTAQKRVLIQDFTGWQCVYCPNAAEVAHSLQQTYGENVVVVSLHPSGIDWTEPGLAGPDFRSDASTAYFQYYGSPSAFPIGVIDQSQFNGAFLQDRNAWTACVQERLAQATPVDMEINCTADTVNHTLAWQTTVFASDSVNSNVSLLMWITESNITAVQAMPDGTYNTSYVHNHVLRDALNGTWGAQINSLQIGENQIISGNYTANAAWNLANCSLIGVLFDTDSKQVFSVLEFSIE